MYSPSGREANPYHVRELTRTELNALLRTSFPHVRVLGQRPLLGSALISEANDAPRSLTFERRGPRHFEAVDGLPRAAYLVAIASDRPVDDVPDSLFIEDGEIDALLAAAAGGAAAATEVSVLRARLEAVERAHAETLSQAARQLESIATEFGQLRARVVAAEDAEKETRAQAVADAGAASAELAMLRGAALAATSQRDLARVVARRAAAAAEGHWRGRVAALESSASAGPRPSSGRTAAGSPRSRRDVILAHPLVRLASRLIPISGRRFVMKRWPTRP